MTEETPSFEVGNRVSVLAKGVPAVNGTVKFSGDTTFAPGHWFGVELDESAGKNDGSVQGKRYFDCKPNYGLFVRIVQLQHLSESGIPIPWSKSPVEESVKPSPTTTNDSDDSNDQQPVTPSPSTTLESPSSTTTSQTPPSSAASSSPSTPSSTSSTPIPTPSTEPSTPPKTFTMTPNTSSSSSSLLPEIESEAVLQLTQSMLDSFRPTLLRISQQLTEIQQSQASLFVAIDSEFTKLAANAETVRKIQEVFSRLPEYDNKAQRSLKEIASINERMQRVKVQTKKLQVRKLKDDEEELKRVRKALEKEKQLLALPADERSKKA